MRGTKFRRASTLNPGTRTFLLAWVDRNLRAGCDGIQVDDGAFQWAGEEWGGDFSPSSLAGFGPWLAQNAQAQQLADLGIRANGSFDYRSWLTQHAQVRSISDYVAKRQSLPTTRLWRRYLGSSVIDFYKHLRQHLASVAPGAPLSMNFGRLQPDEYLSAIAPHLDYTVTEVQADDAPWRFALSGATAEGVGLPFAGCFSNKAPTRQLRQAIASCHAAGIVPVAPWDGFVPAAGGTFGARFTPPPADYADLFAFAHDNAVHLNNRVGAATVGIIVNVASYNPPAMAALVQSLIGSQVPFRVIMTGGDVAPRALTAASLSGLSAVVLMRPASELDAGSRVALASSRLPTISGTDATRYSLGDMPGRADWRFSVRHQPGSPANNVLHITSRASSAVPFSGTIELAAGSRFEIERQSERILLRPGTAPVRVTSTKTSSGIAFNLPAIESWGMLVSA
ncbi:hypothetical protein ACQEPB_00600 [Novosphingobium fluoreni]|uniref:hypothetical protein n=1 Tax=Novosphingobium fluoreni TaxID=1391222 RepID=UPI003DA1345C